MPVSADVRVGRFVLHFQLLSFFEKEQMHDPSLAGEIFFVCFYFLFFSGGDEAMALGAYNLFVSLGTLS